MEPENARHKVADLIADGVLTINDGYRAKNSELSREGLPFARAGNVNNGFHFADADRFPVNDLEKVGIKISQPGDVVFTSKGTVGRFAFVRPGTPRFVFAPQLCFWRSNDRGVIEPRFLYYWMFGREFHSQFTGVKGQTDMADYVSLRDQRAMHITLPPVSRQKAIAHILGTLDDKIELNRRMNETLEQMARAIFKSWFVDFEPVKAKAAGAKSFPSMSQPVFDALPAEFIDSPFGPIPMGWEVCSVSGVAEVNGWTLGKRDELDRIEYVEISEVMRGEISTLAVYQRGSEPSRARRRLRHGDTAMSTVRPDRGAYFLCLDPSPFLIASTGFAVLTPKAVPWSFLYAAMARTDVMEELGRLADGAAYPAVRPEVVGALPLVLPTDRAVPDVFHSVCEPLYSRADRNRRESRTLAAIRDALLPKLLSGEIRVRSAEGHEPGRVVAVDTPG